MSRSSNLISLQAPAKVNLTLAVLDRRPDGYHEIESWVVKVGWFDRLTLAPSPKLTLALDGDPRGTPVDETNLVMRAARALAQVSGRADGAAITLEKRIPVGAGLGGGSSDAASTLLGLNKLWDLQWTQARLQTVAEQIGSDVPLFIEEASAVIIRGRGERIEPLAASWRGWLAIVVPAFSVSTAAVYGALKADRRRTLPSARSWIAPALPAADLQGKLFNDLEQPAIACEPRLAALQKALNANGGRQVRMTGSGSGLFTLFDGRAQAVEWGRMAESRAGQAVHVNVVPAL